MSEGKKLSNPGSATYWLCDLGQILVSLSLSFPIYKMGLTMLLSGRCNKDEMIWYV